MTEKIYICTKFNACPVGDGLYRCCETCEEPCDERPICSRTDCSALKTGDHRDLMDVKMDDLTRVLSAVIDELGDIPSNSELDYSWKENFVRGLDVPEKLKKKLGTPERNW